MGRALTQRSAFLYIVNILEQLNRRSRNSPFPKGSQHRPYHHHPPASWRHRSSFLCRRHNI